MGLPEQESKTPTDSFRDGRQMSVYLTLMDKETEFVSSRCGAPCCAPLARRSPAHVGKHGTPLVLRRPLVTFALVTECDPEDETGNALNLN